MTHPPAHDAEFGPHGRVRPLAGSGLKAVVLLSLAFSTYQLLIAAFHPLSSLVTRSLHVGFLLLIFLIYPATRRRQTSSSAARWSSCCSRRRGASSAWRCRWSA